MTTESFFTISTTINGYSTNLLKELTPEKVNRFMKDFDDLNTEYLKLSEEDKTKSTVDKLFNTNVVGTFLFSRELAKLMSKKKEGRIINFSTVAVPLNLEGEAVYAASKSAVVSLTKILAKEVGSLGITVNAVGPTPVLTDLIKTVPKNKIQELLNQQAIGRLGKFEDVLNIIEFFIKPESSFVTGQVVYLGGIS